MLSSIHAQTKRQPLPAPPQHQPRLRRYGVEIKARLRIGAHLAQVRTIDIGEGGAKVLLETIGQAQRALIGASLKAGSLVLFNATCLAEPRLATIVWQRHDLIGVRFQQALSASEIDCLERHEEKRPA